MFHTDRSLSQARGNLRRTTSKLCLVAAFAALAGFVAQDADARPGGGGGFRGGAGISRPAGGSGFGRTSANRPQRGTGQQRQRAGTANTDATSGNSVRQANSGNTAMASRGSGNTGAVNSGNTRSNTNANSGAVGSGNGNTGVVNNGNVNNGNVGSGNVNTGNVAVGNDVDVDVNGGWAGYPAGTSAAYATGVVVGSTATAAAIGTYYSTLPAGCSPYVYGSYRYYSCASTWYQQQYQSGSTVYVVVSDPTKK